MPDIDEAVVSRIDELMVEHTNSHYTNGTICNDGCRREALMAAMVAIIAMPGQETCGATELIMNNQTITCIETEEHATHHAQVPSDMTYDRVLDIYWS